MRNRACEGGLGAAGCGGWYEFGVALLRRVGAGVTVAIALVSASAEGAAQLRPLDPVRWSALAEGTGVTAWVGGGYYDGQRASLAGTRGRLLEVGDVGLSWRTDRVAIVAAGTALRVFRDEDIFAPPVEETREPTGERRVDVGDFRLTTLIRLTSPGANPSAVLRFGARLPTTDNRTGLERDRTDFYATLAARAGRGPFHLAIESGVGVYGTREEHYEQSDMWVYAARLSYGGERISPSLGVVGHAHGRSGGPVRGNENLGELRLGVRIGGDRWLRIEGIRGLARFSPRLGVRVAMGARLGRDDGGD